MVGILVVLGLAVFALGRYLAGRDLATADQTASVISMFLTIAGLAVAVYAVIQDRRAASSGSTQPVRSAGTGGPPEPVAGPAPGDVENRIEGGTFHGPVIMSRDVRDVVLPPPESPGRRGDRAG